MNRGRLLILAGALAVLGILDAVYLTYLKAEREVSGMAVSSVCNLISEAGCSVALESPMGVIGDVPVSLIAAAAYLVALGLVILGAASERRATFAGAALRLFSVAAVAYSLVLGVYSLIERAPCLYCIGLYVVNIGLLIVSLLLAGPGAHRGLFGDVRRLGMSAGALAVAVVLFGATVAAGQWAFRAAVESASSSQAAQVRGRVQASFAKGTFPVPVLGAPSKGPEGARFTIVEFSDFQ